MGQEIQGSTEGEGLRFALVVARFNPLITEGLLRGAQLTLVDRGVRDDDLTVVRVPGAFELPGACAALLDAGGYHGIIALGCVIRGGTPHFEYVAGETTRGLGALARDHRVPLAFGVLTTDTVEQAIERSGPGGGNKGVEAALTALEMANLYRILR